MMAALLAVVLLMQVRVRRYTPWLYWLSVVLGSIVGTHITDLLTDGMGINLFFSASIFALLLAAIFVVCDRAERTLSIHDIVTLSREFFTGQRSSARSLLVLLRGIWQRKQYASGSFGERSHSAC